MNNPEREIEPLAELLRQGSELDELATQRARQAFLARVKEEPEAPQGNRFLRPLWLAVVPTAAAAVALLYFAWPAPGLDYEVSGAVDESGYIHADLARSAEVRFSDKTRLAAAPGSRLRVTELEAAGALVSVESGRVDANVTHTGASNWRFVAGPFQVQVTGTRFDLNWDAARERLEVVLHEGSVEITGYSGSGRVAVKGGQRFLGDARLRRMLVADRSETNMEARLTADAAAVDSAAEEPALGAAEPDTAAEDAGVKPSVGSGQPERHVTWTKLLSEGQFARVVEEANDMGTERCLASCSAAELSALADAARYTGKTKLAEQCLLGLRERFAKAQGNRAAFLLGRLYEGQGQMSQARTWYLTSLREAPAGSFAAESLAGQMRTTSKLQGKEAAAPLARQYLEKYPSGVHAATARQLVQTP